MLCDQLTVRGELCTRKATIVAEERDGTEEAYCTQHANYYGVKHRRRPWRPAEQSESVKQETARCSA